MTILAKSGVAVLGVGTMASTAVVGYSYFSKTSSFKDNLGESVLTLSGNSNQTQWEARLKDLKSTNTNLPSELAKLKADKNWNDLQKWCFDNSSSKFEKSTNTNYLNFETFCTWKVGDKDWTKKITASTDTDEKWGTAHSKLNGKTGLSASLDKVRLVVKDSQNSEKKAMHKWCTDAYKKTWKNNEEFNEIQTYCRE